MTEALEITVENRLLAEKRDINVYLRSTRGSHIISHSGSVTLPLRAGEEDDYLHISAARGPGNLWKDCMLNIPSWANFEFSSQGNITVTHAGDRTLLKIPPGPPTWQLKMARPTGLSPNVPLSGESDRITISDMSLSE